MTALNVNKYEMRHRAKLYEKAKYYDMSNETRDEK